MKKLILITAAAAALAGCVGESFTRQDYGDAWPFTVDQVTVGCDAIGLPYVETSNRGTYGLTGYAVQQGYPAVTPIHIQGRDLGPFIQSALAQCD